MAMVRMTVEIMKRVRENVRSIYYKKIKDAQDSFDPAWGERIYDIVIGPYVDTLNLVPADFLTHQVEMRLSRAVRSDGSTVDIGTEHKLSPPRAMPVNRTTAVIQPYLQSANYYNTHFSLLEAKGFNPMWDTLFAEVWAYGEAIHMLKVEEDRALDAANAVMRANSTLKGALDDWPALIDLIPDEAKKRHEAPTQKRLAMPKPQVDTSNLGAVTAHLAITKMTK